MATLSVLITGFGVLPHPETAVRPCAGAADALGVRVVTRRRSFAGLLRDGAAGRMQ